MRAIQIKKTGGPEVMEDVELPTPTPGGGTGAGEDRSFGRELH